MPLFWYCHRCVSTTGNIPSKVTRNGSSYWCLLVRRPAPADRRASFPLLWHYRLFAIYRLALARYALASGFRYHEKTGRRLEFICLVTTMT